MGAFDDLVAHLDGALVVVTAASATEVDGCVVGFHSQCSIEPPAYAVWMSVLNRTGRVVDDATHIAVHLLDERDRDLVELFGGESGDEIDKFADVTWSRGPGGAPLLERCPSRFVLEIEQLLDIGGDHRCVVGRPVIAEDAGLDDPLRLSSATDVQAGHPPGEIDQEPRKEQER